MDSTEPDKYARTDGSTSNPDKTKYILTLEEQKNK
jgi:hypothetical protein